MNKTAVITGASRGIGEAITRKFAAAGFDLVLTCINNIEKMEKLGAELASAHKVSVRCFKADMGEEEAVERIFDCIDRVDVLINNAGISYVGLLQDMTYEDWREVMSTNLDSVFLTSRAAVRKMLNVHKGRIINISSMWGNVGASMEAAYSASKGGVDALTKALAKELGPSGITVNCVAPGLIDTPMNSRLSESDIASLVDDTPVGRIGTPEDIASAVLFFCNAPFVTGQTLCVDGGMTL